MNATWSGWLMVISLAVGVTSCWQQNKLAAFSEVHPTLALEPEQLKTSKRKFQSRYAGIAYNVTPEFDYRLRGLVVSYRKHDGNSFMHRASNDHLNVMDMCVVWGSNVDYGILSKLRFWNGVFTCTVQTRDTKAWSQFTMKRLSNNHLISDDPKIRDALHEVEVGDQIELAGWLASYGADGGPVRGTSTTRDDVGNGACESIYVDSVRLLRSRVQPYRVPGIVAWSAFGLLLLLYLTRPHRSS